VPRSDQDAGLKTLYVIRHGQTRWNLERRMQGRLDSPLTDAGGEQAHTHGELLKAMADIGTLYVSPSGRTRETAYIVNSYTRSEVIYTDELQERDLGEWSGLTMDEVAKAFPHAYRSRLDDPYNFSPPGGENLVDMTNRVGPFLDNLLAADIEQVGLVTHQVMSRVILSRLLRLSPVEAVRVVHPNEILYRLRFVSGRVDVSHFVDGLGPRVGLLQHSDNETIARLDTRDTDYRR
jgi:broad specificity phosphatase PhoE